MTSTTLKLLASGTWRTATENTLTFHRNSRQLRYVSATVMPHAKTTTNPQKPRQQNRSRIHNHRHTCSVDNIAEFGNNEDIYSSKKNKSKQRIDWRFASVAPYKSNTATFMWESCTSFFHLSGSPANTCFHPYRDPTTLASTLWHSGDRHLCESH